MFRSSLGFFHEGMQYHNALACNEAVERAPDAFAPSWPQFEDSVPHGPRVRHSHVWPELHQELHQPGIVGQDAYWPAIYLSSDARVEVLNFIRHGTMLAYMLTNGQCPWADVRPRIEQALQGLPDVHVLVYEPGRALLNTKVL